MKQTLLGEPINFFEGKLKRETIFCSIAAVGVLCVNIAACCLRTDTNHYLMLSFNILTDIICGSLLLYRVDTSILIKRQLLRLSKREQRKITAVVEDVLPESHRVPGLNCALVRTGERVLYLPKTDTIRLEKNVEYTFGVVDNVIVEVTS